MESFNQIDPTDKDFLAAIQNCGAKGYSLDQVAVELDLPYGPFMYAALRDQKIKNAWERGILAYQNKFLRIAEDIAGSDSKQALAGAIYCHRHALELQRRSQMLRPDNTAISMGEVLKIEEVISPEVMKIAMDDYKGRSEKNGSDGSV